MYIVYKTTNNLNGNYYIGVHKLTKSHDSYLGSGKGLKRAIKKYGIENFTRTILHSISNVEEAYDLERKELKNIYKLSECYNMHPGGRGIREKRIDNHSKEWRENHSRILTGRKLTENHISKLRKIDRSYTQTKKYRQKISQANKGKIRSKETKEKLREILIFRNSNLSPEERKQRYGHGNKRIKILFDNRIFNSIKEAKEKTGKHYQTIKKYGILI